MSCTTVPYACATDKGRVRERNEDSFCARPDLGLWLLADGMGGNRGGDIASSLAVQQIPNRLAQGISLRQAIATTHHTIKTSAGEGRGEPAMGTTVVALKLDDRHYEICWVGDSRAYLWTDGSLRRITRDHSYVQELVDAFIITDTEAFAHPRRNVITRALGLESLAGPVVDCVTGELFRGQRILLCSDGLTSEVTDSEIAAILALGKDCQATVNQLVHQANAQGGRDNITVILVEAPNDAPATMGSDPAGQGASDTSIGTFRRTKIGSRITGLIIVLVTALLLAAIFFSTDRKTPPDNNPLPVQESEQAAARINKSYVPLHGDKGTQQNNNTDR